MLTTYIMFYKATQAQNFNRDNLPYKGWLQPWATYIALAWEICMVTCFGYLSFKPWSTAGFFQNYTLLLVAPCTFIFWKVVKRTKFVRPSTLDLRWEAPIIDAYEETFLDPPTSFWREVGDLLGLGFILRLMGKQRYHDDRRASTVDEARRLSATARQPPMQHSGNF